MAQRYVWDVEMEVLQGIYFHSSEGYKNLSSPGYRASDFAVERHIGELISVQRYSYLAKAGQLFYFVYPTKTLNGNKQVIGIGQVVYSLQKGRETVLVPFVQYFAYSLSDAIRYRINFGKIFEQYGSNYKDVFSKNLAKQDLNLQPLLIQPNLTQESENGNIDCFEPQEFFGIRGTKMKRYVENLEEGLHFLDCLMKSPNVIRWSFSVILTPVDVDYPERIGLVYGQPAKLQSISQASSLVGFLRAGDQQDILTRFIRYIMVEKKPDHPISSIDMLNSFDIDELDELLRKFVTEYSHSTEKGDEIEKLRFSTLSLVKEIGKKKPSIENLTQLDSNLNKIENALLASSPFLDASYTSPLDVSDELLSEGLTNYHPDTLQEMLDGKTDTKISNDKLKKAIQAKTQKCYVQATEFWKTDVIELNPSIIRLAEQSIIEDGAKFFTFVGVQKTVESIDRSSNFDESVKNVSLFANKLSNLANSNNIDASSHSELIIKSFSCVQEVLSHLQDWLEETQSAITPESYYETDQALIATINECLSTFLNYEKKNGALVTSSSYSNILVALKELLQVTGKKATKSLDEKQQAEQQTLGDKQKKLDEQYKKLKESIRA